MRIGAVAGALVSLVALIVITFLGEGDIDLIASVIMLATCLICVALAEK